MTKSTEISVFDPAIVGPAIRSSFAKLDPRVQFRNPVMFVVEIVAILTTLLFARDLAFGGSRLGFSFQVILWLWFTLLFANFAEAVAEGRGKAQADALRRTRTETDAKRLAPDGSTYELVPATSLKVGDVVVVEIGDIIPSDGEVIEGIASVNEAAITGESAPVIRESGGDRSAVTGGTQVLSDQIKVRITAAAGSTFLDRMISLVEGAQRQKTPNEIALNILLAGMTLIFVLAVVTIPSFAAYAGGAIPIVSLVALFVTLIPTTIGALLSAIGIAGMDRLVRFNVLAMSGRAVEAAGDVDTLLLDKTGTITLGNRQATEFLPLAGIDERDLADAAQLSSLADETPEGRSIVVLAKEKYGIRGREMSELHAHFVPFSAQTRMSGVDMDGTRIRKGAVDAMLADIGNMTEAARELRQVAESVAKSGGTPLAVARDGRLLGIVHLKDIVKGGIRERFAALRQMGIRTVMITGDNPMTAAAIAAEAGVDDFLAQATPENKLELIRAEQAKGKLVAEKGREHEVFAVFKKWGLDAVTIGEVTGDGILRVRNHGQIVAEIPNRELADEAPIYNRPYTEPFRGAPMEGPSFSSADVEADLLKLLASGDISSKRWLWEQYDFMVRTNTLQGPGGDAAVVRIKETDTSVAMALDGNGRYSFLSPREGAKLAAMIQERVDKIRATVAAVAPLIPQAQAAYQDKLKQRLVEALGSADDERVRQEVVLYATRIDVDEELSRLQAHLTEVERILKAGGNAGKRLDFLMQELNREANTLGSKSVLSEVSKASMDLKLLIEQMREQIQNIE